MKTRILFFMMVALLISTTASAYDFTVGGIYYNITDATNKKVAVTYNVGGQASYSGAVTIPAQVTNGANTYNVTGIGNNAFQNSSGLTSVTIPNSVTSIGVYAFANCTNLTSLAIPSSVTSIGQNTFNSCTGLTSVSIPNGITSIEQGSFYNCSSLTSVTIPGSVTSIGGSAFYQCSRLTSVTIPNSVTSIGNSAFSGCSGLTSVTLPGSVTSIASYAFSSCTSLTSISIPSSVTSMGDYFLYDCTALQSVFANWTSPPAINTSVLFHLFLSSVCLYVPAGTTAAYSGAAVWSGFNIKSQTFSDGGINYTITSDTTVKVDVTSSATGDIVIPATVSYGCKTFNVTSIGSQAFYSCTGLTSIIIPNSVTSIGTANDSYGVFEGCSGLTSVTIPNSVTSIGNFTFASCSGLTSVIIPNSVTSIGNAAFYYCSGLTSVVIPNTVTSIAFDIFHGCSGLTSVTIPNSVTNIGDNAFQGCSGLTSLTIPSSVTSIGNSAFSGCSGLTSIIIPNSVTNIGDNAFFGCSSLTSAAISNAVTRLGDGVFFNCSSLTSITIPNSVTSIGTYAFNSCTGLKSVFVSWATPIYSYQENFSEVTLSNICLYVPAGTEAAYAAADVWKDFKINASTFTVGGINYAVTSDNTVKVDATPSATGAITIPATVSYGCTTFNVTSIGDNAFKDRADLTSVVIPNSVTSIGDHAFESCRGLTSLIIPNSVTSIGSQAFSSCSGLTSVTISNAVTTIQLSTFSSCSGLTSVTIPNSVTSIGINAFEGCSGLTSVTFGNALTSIGHEAFRGCRSLTSLTIPNSVTSIGASAFIACSGLTSLTIPNSVTGIGGYAFANCTGLQSVTVGWGTPLTIDATVFNGVTTSGICLYVPAGTTAAYKAAAGWSGFNVLDNLTTFTVGVINYTITSPTTVQVASSTYAVGDIVIPATVAYSCKTFNVTRIGDNAFLAWTNLTSVSIPNSVISIGVSAFQQTALTSVTIPNSVTSIAYAAFAYCGGITSVTIPNSVTSIGQYAFYYCTSLQSVTVGWATPLAIYGNIFSGESTSNICLYVPASTTAAYKAAAVWGGFNVNSSSFTVGGINYTITSNTTVKVDATPSATGAIVIPATVSYGCGTFTVTSIGEGAFFENTGLTSVTIPNTVTSIEGWAFYNCTALTSIVLPNSVTSIGEGAFSNCTSLQSVTVDWTTPLGIDATVFQSVTTANVNLYVPTGTETTYRAADVWKGFNISSAPSGIENVSDKNNLIQVYPNPSSRFVAIKNNKNTSGSFAYTILSANGSFVKTGKAQPDEEINIENLANGVYIIQITLDNGEKISEQLIKK